MASKTLVKRAPASATTQKARIKRANTPSHVVYERVLTLLKQAKVNDGVRSLIIDSYELGKMPYFIAPAFLHISNFAALLAVATGYCPRRGGIRMRPVVSSIMINAAVNSIVDIYWAHDPLVIAKAERKIRALIRRLRTIPIGQLRSIFPKLCDRLAENKAVPFTITHMFAAWHNQSLAANPWRHPFGKPVNQLAHKQKKAIATELTNALMEHVEPEFREAMSNSLMWRPRATLQTVKTALASSLAKGKLPKLVAEGDYLYLQVHDPEGRSTIKVNV